MSRIDIKREHGKNLDAAQQIADNIAADLAEKFHIEYGWDGDELVFSRTGVSGSIQVDDSVIHIQAQLGFFLSYLRPAIEKEINRYLEEHFD